MDFAYLWKLSDQDLDKEYKLLCKNHHPDRQTGDTEKFQLLNNTHKQIREFRSKTVTVNLSLDLSEMYHGCIKDLKVIDPWGEIYSVPVMISPGQESLDITTVYYNIVHIEIQSINNTKFHKDGYNLLLHLDIPYDGLGEPVTVAHFNKVITIPTCIPHSSYRHIMKGYGMPVSNTGIYGDLYVTYNVIFD